MVPRSSLRALALVCAVAALAPPAARAGAWKPGDVEAAERYRELERERALRYRAALEERAGAPRVQSDRRRTLRRGPAEGARPRLDERPTAVFEPWVRELAARLWDVFEAAAARALRAAWVDLRAWLEDLAWSPAREYWRAHSDGRDR
jgi:hypothetical protein